nr:ubiquinone biosynthesis monooxygenase COQ6, mitochondrial-like [Dermatophagoides farinae]
MFKKIFLSDIGFINSVSKSWPVRQSKYCCSHPQHHRWLSNQAVNQENSIIQDDAYDIVINGGGIVGFSMFAAIKSSPFLSAKRVLLIEQQSPPQPSTSVMPEARKFSNRVSAITLSSKEFFEQLKIWDSLSPYAKSIQGMYVWSEHYQNGINFGHDSLYENAMCYILENNRILQALHDLIQSNPNSLQHISYKTSVVDINQDVDVRDSQATTIKLKIVDMEDTQQQQKSIQTRLLIGCDGYKSIVRSKSTLPYFEADLNQMGIVGTLEVETLNNDNHIAFQRFVNDQLVIALLPLDKCHSSLVLSVPKQSLQEWMKLSDQEFISRLNNELIREPKIQSPLDKLASTFNIRQFKYDNAQIRSPATIRSIVTGSRAAFPLGFGTTIPFMVGTIQAKVPLLQALINKDKRVNTAIIGDAAHRVHPLAGQGLNLGLGDASTLFSCLDSKLSAGYELFASRSDSHEALSQALYDFERCRVLKLIPMMTAIHSMQTLFHFTPSVLLPIVNQMDMAKKLIVSFANSR